MQKVKPFLASKPLWLSKALQGSITHPLHLLSTLPYPFQVIGLPEGRDFIALFIVIGPVLSRASPNMLVADNIDY